MSKIINSFTGIALAIVMMLSVSFVSEAAGSTSIVVSKSTVSVGESTTVTVKSSTSTKVKVKYTSSMLEFDSCDAADYSAESNTVTFTGTEANLVFKAIGGGTASLIVSGDSVSGSSTTVSISGDAAPAETAEPETASADETSEAEGETPVADEPVATSAVTYVSSGYLTDNGNFDIDGVEYVVSERYSAEEIPAGFSDIVLNIAGHTYKSQTNGQITIIYLKPADNTAGSGVFYLYDAENAMVSPFEFVSASGHYILLGTAGYTVYEDMTQTEVTIGSKTCIAYVIPGSEFYYIFGTDDRGILDWYCYDPAYNSFSRIDTAVLDMIATTTDQEATVESVYDPNENYILKLGKYRKIIAALVVISILLAFAFVKVKFIDEAGGDEDEDVIFAEKKPEEVKKKLKASASKLGQRTKPSKSSASSKSSAIKQTIVIDPETLKVQSKTGNESAETSTQETKADAAGTAAVNDETKAEKPLRNDSGIMDLNDL